MFKRLIVAVIAAPAAVLLGLAGAGAANASVSPVTVHNSNGEAGIYAFSGYPFFQDVSNNIPLTLAMEGNSDTSAGGQTFGVGDQLGDQLPGSPTDPGACYAAQAGVIYNGDGTFDVVAEDSTEAAGSGLGNVNSSGDLVDSKFWGTGTGDQGDGASPAATPNDASYVNAACVTGGALPDPLTYGQVVLYDVPEGDTVSLKMTQVGDIVYVYASDVTAGIAENQVNLSVPSGTTFDNAGAGTVQNSAELSAPDTYTLSDLGDLAFSSGDITAGPSYFSAVNVVSNASGNSADPDLVAGTLSPGSDRVCTTTGEKGHWSKWIWTGKPHHEHRHHHWIRSTLKTTCTPGTQASEDLVEGAQTGA
jgi:hypothetical protein